MDRDTDHALVLAYRNGITRYQKLLKTRLTDMERNFIMERLSACQAAVEALRPKGTISDSEWL